MLGVIQLRNGDILAMEKWTQDKLKDSIAKLPPNSDEEPRRINLTWRWLILHKLGCMSDCHHTLPGPPTLPVTDAMDNAEDEAETAWCGKPE